MALYAFDGTWNEDEAQDDRDTNVVKFREVYAGAEFEYLNGVGARHGVLGRVLGGLFGAGGRTRIEEMMDALNDNWAAGDRDIDIIGFSRGAALAVHFANKIAEDGVGPEGARENPPIRFLGVWDIVGSFGLSFDTFVNFQDINLGWDIDRVANTVQHCFHAMALDERRETFNVTRLDPDQAHAHIREVWFRGVHSDIGGGNENPLRSNIALQWMLDRAREVGLPLNESRAREPKYAAIDPAAPVSENKDVQRDPRRTLMPGDEVHPTALGRRLAVGDTHTSVVLAASQYNWSGVTLENGASYRISVDGDQTWIDGDLERGPEGWSTDELSNWFKRHVVERFEDRRRYPDGNWFLLLGALGDEDDHVIPVGRATDYTAEDTADLYLFANDLLTKYGNNKGSLEVSIQRTA